jgi:hypothetical protein
MALTGHLSDLSLSELIEFFCNQRKSGRLKVLYPQGPGYFYLQAGSVVDARIGVLHGIDAVYYALTLPNAQFEFSADAEAGNRTINQPWTQVVLEGLRRLDENISPGVAFPAEFVPEPDELGTTTAAESSDPAAEVENSFAPAFLAFGKEGGRSRKPFFIGAAVVAVIASVAVIGVPAGWYKRGAPATAAAGSTSQAPAPAPQTTQAETPAEPQPAEAAAEPTVEDPAVAARRQREKERRAREAAEKNTENASTAGPGPATDTRSGAKRVVVTVTYDESGRVTQASGGDANALRIARQKRFPPGKAGSATISIPIN